MKPFLLFLFLSGNFNVKACECKRISFKDETDNSDMIFRGTITKKDSTSSSKFYYSFAISQIWKGEPQKAVVLSSWNHSARCGINLDLGKDYIIYSKNGQISLCGRNELHSIASTLPLLNYKFVQTDAIHYGADSSNVLNSFESTYFNAMFNDRRHEAVKNNTQINFGKRKVVFLINGSPVSKKMFFEFNRRFEPSLYFYKFKPRQVERSGGYMGIIYLDKTLKNPGKLFRKSLKI